VKKKQQMLSGPGNRNGELYLLKVSQEMNARDYIVYKQVQWAKNQGLELIGSKNKRGRKTYTKTLDENLFEPLSSKCRKEFLKGDGSELTEDSEFPSKMQALHSSSALGVNIFQYWDTIQDVPTIAQSCCLCRNTTTTARTILFECKYPVEEGFRTSPNIDVVIQNAPESQYEVYAIECKFTEAYSSRGHAGLKKKYLDLDIWSSLPKLHKVAVEISPKDNRFEFLHAAQLIKHILGLRRTHGKKGFRLLYLWYDAFGREGAKHRAEADEFMTAAKQDGIKFYSKTYQELITYTAQNHRDSHQEYVEYITTRYL